MTPDHVGFVLSDLGIPPREMEDDGTFITFHTCRLVEVMQALGGAGDHLDDARVFVDDFREGPEIKIEMTSISWSVAIEAYEEEERLRSEELAEIEVCYAVDAVTLLGIIEAAKPVPPRRSRRPKSRFARREVV